MPKFYSINHRALQNSILTICNKTAISNKERLCIHVRFILENSIIVSNSYTEEVNTFHNLIRQLKSIANLLYHIQNWKPVPYKQPILVCIMLTHVSLFSKKKETKNAKNERDNYIRKLVPYNFLARVFILFQHNALITNKSFSIGTI